MAELRKSAPVYSLFPQRKNYIIAIELCYSVWFGERKTENFSYYFRAISSFWSIYSIQGEEKTQFTFIVDRGWR